MRVIRCTSCGSATVLPTESDTLLPTGYHQCPTCPAVIYGDHPCPYCGRPTFNPFVLQKELNVTASQRLDARERLGLPAGVRLLFMRNDLPVHLL